jgi:hypothetical protein
MESMRCADRFTTAKAPSNGDLMEQAGQTIPERFSQLQRAKEDSRRELLKRKPGHKHYRRGLKAYLEADDALQRAIVDRLRFPGMSLRLRAVRFGSRTADGAGT